MGLSAACTVHAPDTAAPSTGYTQTGTGYYTDGTDQPGYDDQTVYSAPVQTDDVVYSEEPTLVAIEPDLYVIRDADQPVYWVDNSYWRYDDSQSTWYRSPSYVGGWVSVGVGYVPPRIASRDHHHYMHYHGEHGARTLRAPAPAYTPPAAPTYEARATRPPPLHIGRVPTALPNQGVAHAPPVAPVAPVVRPNVAPPAVPPPTAQGGGPPPPHVAPPTHVERPNITLPTAPAHVAPPAAAPNVAPHVAQPPVAPHVAPPPVAPHGAPPPAAAPPVAPHVAAPSVAPHVAPPAQAAPAKPNGHHGGHHK